MDRFLAGHRERDLKETEEGGEEEEDDEEEGEKAVLRLCNRSRPWIRSVTEKGDEEEEEEVSRRTERRRAIQVQPWDFRCSRSPSLLLLMYYSSGSLVACVFLFFSSMLTSHLLSLNCGYSIVASI